MRQQQPRQINGRDYVHGKQNMLPELNYDDYTIVWFAILDVEVETAMASLEKKHEGRFPVSRQDDYTYIAGEIENHNVVIAKLPEGEQHGNRTSASLAEHVKSKFKNIWFALLVGVAAGIPSHTVTSRQARDIRLGDVLVCVPSRHSPGVVHFDYGSDTEEGFKARSRQDMPSKLVRSAISHVKHAIPNPYKSGNQLAQMLQELQEKADKKGPARGRFAYPGQDKDEYFVRDQSVNTLSQDRKLERLPRDSSEVTQVWYGNIGSSNSVMRNAKRRDELQAEDDLIGLEMEAAGLMNTLPTGVIRGVCDYADSHKSDSWQPYAAAVAAVYARALLGQLLVPPKDREQKKDAVTRILRNCRFNPHLLNHTSKRYRYFMTPQGMTEYAVLWDIVSRGQPCITYDEMKIYIPSDEVPSEVILKFWLRFGEPNERFQRSIIMAIFFMIHLEYLNEEVLGTEEAHQYEADVEGINCFIGMDQWAACSDNCGREWNFAAHRYGFWRRTDVGRFIGEQCLQYRRQLEKINAGKTSECDEKYESGLDEEQKDEAEKMREADKRKWLRQAKHACTSVSLA